MENASVQLQQQTVQHVNNFVTEFFDIYRIIQNDCRGFNSLSYTNKLEIGVYVFFYLIEQHSKFLLHTFQVLYM